MVHIPASYLHLIEHNRRRVGVKLLLDIARALGTEPSWLSKAAEVALRVTLRETGSGNRRSGAGHGAGGRTSA